MEFFIPIAVVVFVTIMTRVLNARSTGGRNPGTPSPRVQRLLERLEAQQRGSQPMGPTGQYTQPAPYGGAGGGGPVGDGYGTPGNANMPVQSSTQMAGVLDFRRHAAQSGHQPSTPGQYAMGPHAMGPYPGQAVPGQFPDQYAPPGPPPSMPFAQPGQFEPSAPWFQQPPQSHQLPAVKPSPSPRDLDARVREMMKTGNEVGAVRLLCDEQDLSIIDAQKRARALVAPAGGAGSGTGGPAEHGRTAGEHPESGSSADSRPPDEETRYVGSSAFAQSLFDTDRDEQQSWASGWIDPPDADDRTDIDELWQTVRDGRGRD